MNFSRINSEMDLKKALLVALFLPTFVFKSWSAWAVVEGLAPEAATGRSARTLVEADKFMVVTAHPLATEAGYQILRSGGSAMDAAVAVQAVLTLVEPQSSGIGGGAFMLHWDQGGKYLQAFDGRETAPLEADGRLFIDADGKPIPWPKALVGGRSVGTPGVLKMLELGHQQHGRLPWSELFTHAIAHSRNGFEVTPRLQKLLEKEINPGLKRYSESRNYFYPNGQALQAGERVLNKPLAATFEAIANQGTEYFYQGPLADRIVFRVRGAEGNPGLLSQQDLKDYRALERRALCRPWQQYRVCSMPPPTSGGVTLLQILGLLESQQLAKQAPFDADSSHLFTQASRLAYADRGRYLADSDFVEVPVDRLLDKQYLDQRASTIDPQQDMGKAEAGTPVTLSRSDDRSPELPSTSHFVIVDGEGNGVSMTTSIEMAFGSTLMVDGFLLNNQLTDFSFVSEQDGGLVANRVEPGKRPRSSMTPVMVFDQQGRLRLLLGSPGGSRIINYVAKALLGKLVWEMDIQQAISQANISNRNGTTELEAGTNAEALSKALQAKGHKIKIRDLNSGLHGIWIAEDGGLQGGVDPRREGLATGQ
ncbi:MAG: gamma-glutamyltransferase [Motiliproteus sp.]|nr:gamma-glutamyltransferase [Motiliproteus sp.]MCW9051456.1 gamma-glutamyltransferase [Motiliproteus sp.]